MTASIDHPEGIRQLAPGATLGVIGGGQLGRYFALKARQFGYSVWVLDPDANAPAMQIATVPLVAKYDDEQALLKLAHACDGVTIEFENVPAHSLELLQQHTQVAPGAKSVELAQDRLLEKQKASACGLRPVPYVAVSCADEVIANASNIQFPAILKTTRLGYDGKGQVLCQNTGDVISALESFGSVACVLEQRINLAAEVSVVLARGFDGQVATFPVAQNVHVNGILHTSTVPAVQSEALLATACKQACALASAVDHVGVLAVEFFVDDDGVLYFNEMAPRPHNSGHYTLDATVCCQFEQQLRVLCAQPLGSSDLLSPVSMVNLLGDVWTDATPTFSEVFDNRGCQLHLYGKQEARPGRKMGHINCLASDNEAALTLARKVFASLG